jgi:hypothetical protein
LRAWFDAREIERIWSAHQSGIDKRKKIWTLFALAVAAGAPSSVPRQGGKSAVQSLQAAARLRDSEWFDP